MSAVVGFVPESLVWTPSGPRAIAELAPGDAVVTSLDGRVGLVRSVHRAHNRHLYRLEVEGTVVQGLTPGTAVMDSFEDMFRGAGSLSSLAELRDRAGASAPLLDAVEYTRDVDVFHLTLEGNDHSFFVDGVLVRHVPGPP